METEAYALFTASVIVFFAACYQGYAHILHTTEQPSVGTGIRIFFAALGQCGCFAVLSVWGIDVPLMTLICMAVNFLLCWVILRTNRWISVGIALWIAYYGVCYQTISAALVALFSQQPIYAVLTDNAYSAVVSFMQMLLVLGTILVCIYIDETMWKQFYFNTASCHKLVVVHSAVTMFMLCSSINLYFRIDEVWYKLLQVMIGIIMIAMYNLVFWYERRIANLQDAENHRDQNMRAMEFQRAHFSVYKDFVHFNREVRHELREMTATVDFELEKGRIDEAREELNKACHHILTQLADEKEMSNSELICSLLYEYSVFCQNRCILFDAQVFLPEKGSIPEQECHQIISGTLEALLNVVKASPAEERSICVKSSYRNGWLVLGFVSSWGSWMTSDGTIPTGEKSIRRALNLEWVCALAEKRDGIVMCNASGEGESCQAEITMSFPPQKQ